MKLITAVFSALLRKGVGLVVIVQVPEGMYVIRRCQFMVLRTGDGPSNYTRIHSTPHTKHKSCNFTSRFNIGFSADQVPVTRRILLSSAS
jgi:hypothetical protein